eukprot:Skav217344  [mRNA]  locus=scaffold1410:402598:403008:+ [translate_table: standard]
MRIHAWQLRVHLVDLLHLRRFICCSFNFLKRWQVVIIAESLVIIVNAQAKLDHAMDAACELGGLIQVEAGGEERSVEEQPDQILHSLVGLVCSCLLLELNHDGVLWVHFHRLLGNHVGGHGVVAKGLRFHDALHVG